MLSFASVMFSGAARILTGLLLLSLLGAIAAEAQSSSGGRRSADGRKFPTWEQEDDSTNPHPLPHARQGRHVLELTISLEGATSGVVRLDDGSLLVALLDGRAQRWSLEGERLSEVALGSENPWAPIAAGPRALLVAGTSLTAVGAEGIAWELELGAAPLAPPVSTRGGIALTLPGGELRLLEAETGRSLWTAEVASATCGPAQSGELLAWGTSDGRLVALRATDGGLVWDLSVADSIASVGADQDSIYFSAKGETGRSKKSRGPFVGRLSISGKQPEVEWRARVGGISQVPPLPLDELIAFACFDGYVHAHARRSGALLWRTDLPARVTVPPRLFAGRLDYLLPLTGWVVAIAADNGGVMGYTELPDPDEAFIGSPVISGPYTIVATSFGRLVGLRWEYDPNEPADDSRESGERFRETDDLDSE